MGVIDQSLHLPFAAANLPTDHFYREGWVRHHLTPLQCLRDAVLGPFLLRMRDSGFYINDFRSNGILLPTLSTDSRMFGLPVHVGGHPNYNSRIMKELHVIRSFCESLRADSRRRECALVGLRGLQRWGREAIMSQGAQRIDRVILSGRTDGDLDVLIDRLFRC